MDVKLSEINFHNIFPTQHIINPLFFGLGINYFIRYNATYSQDVIGIAQYGNILAMCYLNIAK